MELRLILGVAVAIILAQWLSNRVFKPTPKQEVEQRTTSGDPVKDFLDGF